MTHTLRIGSVSRATRARKALAAIGISSRMRKTDAAVTETGCTWGLVIADADLYRAVCELRRLGIPYDVL